MVFVICRGDGNNENVIYKKKEKTNIFTRVGSVTQTYYYYTDDYRQWLSSTITGENMIIRDLHYK